MGCDPLKERFRRTFESGGIGIVEILFRCNILALVGGGESPKYPPNKVMVWDDYQNKCIAELECRSPVKGVKLRRDKIVVVLINQVFVYNFTDLALLDQIKTCTNPTGLCALAPNANTVLACPSEKIGYVTVKSYDGAKEQLEIYAHNGALSQICLSADGRLLATSSEKGTLIRVFDTASGQQRHEFRRGADRAGIFSLAFSKDCKYVCCSSDKGTVHVFGLPPDSSDSDDNRNQKSNLAFMKSVLPSYFGSEWSFAQVHLAKENCKMICCFGQESNTLILLCSDGTHYKYQFDELKGGEAKVISEGNFLKAPSV